MVGVCLDSLLYNVVLPLCGFMNIVLVGIIIDAKLWGKSDAMMDSIPTTGDKHRDNGNLIFLGQSWNHSEGGCLPTEKIAWYSFSQIRFSIGKDNEVLSSFEVFYGRSKTIFFIQDPYTKMFIISNPFLFEERIVNSPDNKIESVYRA